MNEELIQQLVDQCVDKRERDGRTVEVLQSRKFAELIVRECIDIAGKEDFDVMMKEGYPCSQTAKKIREQFGVEE